MKIKPLLARLQNAIGRDDLIDKMVLLPEPQKCISKTEKIATSVNLIVGYDASPQSHTALDIACWIAHQTSLATKSQVTVHAVYVVEEKPCNQYTFAFKSAKNQTLLESSISDTSNSLTLVLDPPKFQETTPHISGKSANTSKQADRIIWQANNLAQEWQSDFKSHLRFGSIARELNKVVELESADILFLGCKSVNHPMIKTLGNNFPCAVLGIPNCIDE